MYKLHKEQLTLHVARPARRRSFDVHPAAKLGAPGIKPLREVLTGSNPSNSLFFG